MRLLFPRIHTPANYHYLIVEQILAMQFSAENALSGTALIYKREKVSDTEYTVKLVGYMDYGTDGGLETNKKGCLIVNEDEMTTREGVFAGGDAVTGAATVILAMGAGKNAAKAIDNYIQNK